MRLVIDSSALVAIATEEPECDSFIKFWKLRIVFSSRR
jgi:uncharacterized protein with PIN domain